jgi:hypothetical protein
MTTKQNLTSSPENIDIIRNLESFTCVWLDQAVDKTEDNRETEQRLRQIINHLYTCDDKDKCERYIRDIIQEKIVFIVSGAFGQDLIPRIHNLSQLSACYVFCGNKKKHIEWANQYAKVMNFYFFY